MAPSSGYLLVHKTMRIFKLALDEANAIFRSKLPASTTAAGKATLQPIRIYAQTQSVHPLVQLRQSRSQQQRWFSKSTRNATSASGTAGQYNRSSFPVSKTSRAIARSGATPFASTLRPNLMGALPRTAGGYSLGGNGRQGVRHFSHTPAAQAQVVQDVSAGIRAFAVGGGKARYDGLDKRTGERKYKAITKTQDKVLSKLSASSISLGSTLEFRLSPIITALNPSFSTTSSPDTNTSLNTPHLLSNLSTDFARTLHDFSLVLNDLRRLAALGDLPLTLTHTVIGPVLVVRFPGCDARAVEVLCDEVAVKRGVVREDLGWQEDKGAAMALLFPFASSEAVSEVGKEYFEHAAARQPEQLDWRHMLSPSERPMTTLSELLSDLSSTEIVHQPLLTPLESPEGYESLQGSDFGSEGPPPVYHHHQTAGLQNSARGSRGGSEEYEGLEGIYKFLRECEDARR